MGRVENFSSPLFQFCTSRGKEVDEGVRQYLKAGSVKQNKCISCVFQQKESPGNSHRKTSVSFACLLLLLPPLFLTLWLAPSMFHNTRITFYEIMKYTSSWCFHFHLLFFPPKVAVAPTARNGNNPPLICCRSSSLGRRAWLKRITADGDIRI